MTYVHSVIQCLALAHLGSTTLQGCDHSTYKKATILLFTNQDVGQTNILVQTAYIIDKYLKSTKCEVVISVAQYDHRDKKHFLPGQINVQQKHPTKKQAKHTWTPRSERAMSAVLRSIRYDDSPALIFLLIHNLNFESPATVRLPLTKRTLFVYCVGEQIDNNLVLCQSLFMLASVHDSAIITTASEGEVNDVLNRSFHNLKCPMSEVGTCSSNSCNRVVKSYEFIHPSECRASKTHMVCYEKWCGFRSLTTTLLPTTSILKPTSTIVPVTGSSSDTKYTETSRATVKLSPDSNLAHKETEKARQTVEEADTREFFFDHTSFKLDRLAKMSTKSPALALKDHAIIYGFSILILVMLFAVLLGITLSRKMRRCAARPRGKRPLRSLDSKSKNTTATTESIFLPEKLSVASLSHRSYVKASNKSAREKSTPDDLTGGPSLGRILQLNKERTRTKRVLLLPLLKNAQSKQGKAHYQKLLVPKKTI